jgi:hypothetical protein
MGQEKIGAIKGLIAPKEDRHCEQCAYPNGSEREDKIVQTDK